MNRLLDKLNRSRTLARVITFFSTRLAHYRGVPILAGVILTVVSFFLHLVAAATGGTVWSIMAFTALHLAIFSGLLGVLLAEPLGKG